MGARVLRGLMETVSLRRGSEILDLGVWWMNGKVDVACGRNMRLEILHGMDRGLVVSWLYKRV
jgi:hypothetical protein